MKQIWAIRETRVLLSREEVRICSRRVIGARSGRRKHDQLVTRVRERKILADALNSIRKNSLEMIAIGFSLIPTESVESGDLSCQPLSSSRSQSISDIYYAGVEPPSKSPWVHNWYLSWRLSIFHIGWLYVDVLCAMWIPNNSVSDLKSRVAADGSFDVSSNSGTINPRVMVGFLRGNVIMFARLETGLASVGFSRQPALCRWTPLSSLFPPPRLILQESI